MNATILLVCLLLAAALGLFVRARQPAPVIPVWRSSPAARPRARAASTAPVAVALGAGPAPEPGPVEWDPPVAATAPARMKSSQDALAARLRDRYIVARFPGMPGGVAALLEVEQVIKAARLYFEEEKFERALELLELAGQHSPAEKAFPLARLEIAFLAHDAALFAAVAGEFRARHGDAAEWTEVARLGARIAPADPLFAARTAEPDHPHYGPWPDMPNWIHASWDLTSEVLAADFHRALTAAADVERAPAATRRAA